MPSKRGTVLAALLGALLSTTFLRADADPLPAPWVAGDIGGIRPAGETSVDAQGVWTLRGSGRDIFGEVDRFHFAYRPVRGNASITARFLTLSGGDSVFAKAGLMVRADATPGSTNLNYAMTPGHGLHVSFRPEPGGGTWAHFEVGPSRKREPNLWMRLQRVGPQIAAFYSRDGRVWTQADFPVATLPELPEEALFGFALSSHVTGGIATATFDAVTAAPGQVSVYGVRGCGGDRMALLLWRPLDGAIGYNVYRGPADASPDRFVRLNADRVTGTSFTDLGEGLVNGNSVTYLVAAVMPGATGDPVEGLPVAVSVTPVAAPPSWLGCGIDMGPRMGSVGFEPATGEVTLQGAGNWIDLQDDQCYFAGEVVEGDIQITATLLARPRSAVDFAALAGLMIRESLDGDARHLTVGFQPPLALQYQWRARTGGDTFRSLLIADPELPLPITLRLTRRGSTISAGYSRDGGQTFRPLHSPAVSFNPPLPKTLYVGLAITSGDRFREASARFRDVEIRKL